MESAMKNMVIIALKGFAMGCADIIPGVSGGTMAYILGIYERLLGAIKGFNLSLLKQVLSGKVKALFTEPDWALILPLMVGILSAVVFFTRVVPIPILLENEPQYVYALFFGLILGSVALLLWELGKISCKELVLIIVGITVGMVIVNLVPTSTPDAAWFVFLAGSVAILAMLVPGISGSFILLILGKYTYILQAVGGLNLSVLLPFIAGMVTGLLAFSRAIHWLITHYHRESMLVINGILIGTLWIIWPFQERTYVVVGGKEKLIHSEPILPLLSNPDLPTAIGLMIISLGAVFALNGMAKR
jgi:putative membrane protein